MSQWKGQRTRNQAHLALILPPPLARARAFSTVELFGVKPGHNIFFPSIKVMGKANKNGNVGVLEAKVKIQTATSYLWNLGRA